MNTANANIQTKSIGEPKKRSLWANAWKKLKRNKRAMAGLYFLLFLVVVAILAPVLAPQGYDVQNPNTVLLSPSWSHPLGTDNYGRDVLVRIMYGSQISLQLGFISVSIALVIGGFIGAIAGFYGGKLDNIIMRSMDIFQSIPPILLAIAIATTLGEGIMNAMIAIGISNVPGYTRLIRGSILSVREVEYVEAARVITASDKRIIFKHILPNVMSPMLVQTTLGIAGAILTAASLSFIGLGAQAPIPEWGAMISGSRSYIRDYWYLVTAPGVAIMITVISFNLFGDGIRDVLDPRMTR